MTKKRVAIIFGGRSSEHEVSLVSATAVMRNLDPSRYDMLPVGITKQGEWRLGANILNELKNGSNLTALPALLSTDHTQKGLVVSAHERRFFEKIDIAFPVVHGPFGEDGTLQGLLEMLNVPYVGCGVLASSVAMDKIVFKQLMRSLSVPVAVDVAFTAHEWHKDSKKVLEAITKTCTLPVFVKPANMGSSVGITKVKTLDTLGNAITDALRYDSRIIVEQGIAHAREIEMAVLGNNDPDVSVPGEIIPSNEFYDYNAKYVDGKSRDQIPAKISPEQRQKMEQYAKKAYKAIDASGMARVDFLIDGETGKVFLNEMNTIPGFTSISMYAKLWEKSGKPYTKLLDRLIELGLEKYQQKQQRQLDFVPSAQWYNQP